jgi:hypothetical protein
MTPKEKARELVRRYETFLFNRFTTDDDWVQCVECALIAVDEILDMYFPNHLEEKYWQEVKQEIEKL